MLSLLEKNEYLPDEFKALEQKLSQIIEEDTSEKIHNFSSENIGEIVILNPEIDTRSALYNNIKKTNRIKKSKENEEPLASEFDRKNTFIKALKSEFLMPQNFSKAKLQGYSFQGQDLTGTNFNEADLRGVNFTNAILKGANFSHARTGIQTSWTISLVLMAWVFAIAASFIFSAIAGVCAGIILAFGELAISFCAVAMLITFALFAIVTKRYGLGRAVGTLIATLPLTFVTALVMAVVGGLSGLVPYSGAEGVAAVFCGAIVGAFIAIMTMAAALSVAVAETMAGTAGVAGILLIMLTALGTMVTAVTGSLIMSMAQTGETLLSEDGLIAVNEVMAKLHAQSISPSEASARIFSLAGENAGVAAIVGILAIAIPAVALGSYITWRTLAGDERYRFIRQFAVRWTSAFGTRFRGADLTDADFTGASLESADFTGANLTRTCWYRSENLSRARLERTYLNEPEIRRLVVTKQGQNQIFNNQNLQTLNLRGANLENAQFIGTNFYKTDLQEANLSRAILVRSQLDRAKLNGACLTGACIENWGITKTTEIDKIEAQHIYLEWVNEDKRNRLPQDSKFTKGEFGEFIQSSLKSFTLCNNFDVDAKAALKTLEALATEYQEPIQIIGVKNQNDKIYLEIQSSESIQDEIQERYQAKYDEQFSLMSLLDKEVDTADELEVIRQKFEQAIEEVKQTRSLNINYFYNNRELVLGGNFDNSVDVISILAILGRLQKAMESDIKSSDFTTEQIKERIRDLIEIAKEANTLPINIVKQNARDNLRHLAGMLANSDCSSASSPIALDQIRELKSLFRIQK